MKLFSELQYAQILYALQTVQEFHSGKFEFPVVFQILS